MNRPWMPTIGMIVGAIIVVVLAFQEREADPAKAFKRHFGDAIPDSVSDISVSGHTAIAGSDEILTFRIDHADLEAIVLRRGFNDVTKEVSEGGFSGIRADLWKHSLEAADSLGFSDPRYYEIDEFDGMVCYLLIVDKSSTIVYYRYFKV